MKLAEIAEITTGFPFDGHKYTNKGIRVVRGENIGKETIHWEERVDKRWDEKFSQADKYSLHEGDIVMQMDGNIGKNIARISLSDVPSLLAQRVGCLRSKGNNNQDYVYYILLTKAFKDYITRCTTGTSIQHVSLQQIGDFEFDVHSIDEQKKKATVLSDLDRKIALNHVINQKLVVYITRFNLPKTISFAVFAFNDAFFGQIYGNGLYSSLRFAYMRSDFFLRGFGIFSQEIKYSHFFQSAIQSANIALLNSII